VFEWSDSATWRSMAELFELGGHSSTDLTLKSSFVLYISHDAVITSIKHVD